MVNTVSKYHCIIYYLMYVLFICSDDVTISVVEEIIKVDFFDDVITVGIGIQIKIYNI